VQAAASPHLFYSPIHANPNNPNELKQPPYHPMKANAGRWYAELRLVAVSLVDIFLALEACSILMENR